MIAHTALELYDIFTPRFTSRQSIMNSVNFFLKLRCNSGLIFKFLRLYVIFELILCCVHILLSGPDSSMYKMQLVYLCIKPKQTCWHLGAVSYRKLYKILTDDHGSCSVVDQEAYSCTISERLHISRLVFYRTMLFEYPSVLSRFSFNVFLSSTFGLFNYDVTEE